MPLAKNLIEAAGNATQATYVEDVFSTYLVTGTGSTLNVVNGIDLAGKGGMVWAKRRDAAGNNIVVDTARGGTVGLVTNNTAANISVSTTFNADGYSTTYGSAYSMASWTFRKQPKFFDVVTWTSNGLSTQAVNHSLGVVPAFIVYKRTDAASDWIVLALNSSGTYYLLYLNKTDASPIAPLSATAAKLTSTTFNMNAIEGSAAGQTYVAYMFASNAGGFGLTGTDNVISCGSFTTDGSGNASVNLGWEPQYVLYKKSNADGQWYIEDTMRGLYAPSQVGATLIVNLSNAEGAGNGSLWLNSTGFTVNPAMNLGTSTTCIYIAIRRGPMKVPTDGTTVFAPVLQSSQGTITTNFPVDLSFNTQPSLSNSKYFIDRLRGGGAYLRTELTDAEGVLDAPYAFTFDSNTGFKDNTFYPSGRTVVFNNLRRAPSFFDEVCYKGQGSTNQAISHNLTVPPELIISKDRDQASPWWVYAASQGRSKYATLNTSDAFSTLSNAWGTSNSTATTYYVNSNAFGEGSGISIVSYLFATCPGVSKVGSYTGTGTTKQVDCGFAAGARFVLVKATSTTGDWIVVDTARGLVSGNDPTLLLNSTAAEVTTNDWFDPYSAGFELSSAGGNLANTNGVSYIFFAVA